MFMQSLFIILGKITSLILILGLLNPRYPLYWMTNRTRMWVAIIYLPLAVIFFTLGLNLPASTQSKPEMLEADQNIRTLDSLIPTEEREFLNIINQYIGLYKKALNAEEKTKVWQERENKIKDIKPPVTQFSHWVGTINQIGALSNEKIVVKIALNNHVLFQTHGNSESDQKDHTLILPDSPLYENVSTLDSGNQVRISGVIIGKATGAQNEEMLGPRYIVKFTQIESAN
jgi:hypothetical protein